MRSEVYTTALNLVWTVYNMLILGASVAQRANAVSAGGAPRDQIPVTLKFSRAARSPARPIDYSEGGVGVALPDTTQVPRNEKRHGLAVSRR